MRDELLGRGAAPGSRRLEGDPWGELGAGRVAWDAAHQHRHVDRCSSNSRRCSGTVDRTPWREHGQTRPSCDGHDLELGVEVVIAGAHKSSDNGAGLTVRPGLKKDDAKGGKDKPQGDTTHIQSQ